MIASTSIHFWANFIITWVFIQSILKRILPALLKQDFLIVHLPAVVMALLDQ